MTYILLLLVHSEATHFLFLPLCLFQTELSHCEPVGAMATL